MVTEDEFWRNYFYSIELIKKNMGLPCRIGSVVDEGVRERRIQYQEHLLNEARLQVEAREMGMTYEQATASSSNPSARQIVPDTDRSLSSAERLDDDSGIELAEL
jgi:hypothetical protein